MSIPRVTSSVRGWRPKTIAYFVLLFYCLTIFECDCLRFPRSFRLPITDNIEEIQFKQQLQNAPVCSIQCSTGNGPSDSIWKYAPDVTYTYRAEGTALLWPDSSTRNAVSQLNYLTDFEIRFDSSCSAILKLNGVQLFTSTGKKYSDKTILEGSPIRFSFENGKISSQICADVYESPIALNIKRAILSNLQISSSDSNTENFEVDIFGQCPTSYEYKKDTESSWIVRKNKDINRCVNRDGLQRQNDNGGYGSSNPFLKATVSSEFTIADGIIQRVEVIEQYAYLPLSFFSNTDNSVTVKSVLTFVSQNKKPITGIVSVLYPSTLLYQIPPPMITSVGIDAIMNALKDASTVTNSYGSNVSPTAATEFKKFVHVLRQANKMEILTAFTETKSGAGLKEKSAARACFVDGLLSAGTDQSVEALINLVRSKIIPGNKISSFFSTLQNVKYITPTTLKLAETILDQPVDSEAYIGVGVLAGKYVQIYPDRVNEPILGNLLKSIAAPILRINEKQIIKDENKLITSMKGLQNVKHSLDEIVRKLIQFAKDKNASNRFRSVALQTLKTYSTDEMKKATLEILLDKTEDAEIRINAFRAYIINPDKETAYQIKLLIDTEESIQVGGYVVSYINGLRHTIQPDKQIAKEYFANVVMKKRFPKDIRQYSQNLEVSQILAALNFGYSANIDVIYSADSYVPRYASFNLNSYVFGKPIDLFQVDVRVENLDLPVENIFGPRSYLQTNNVEDIADDFSNYITSIPDMISKRYSVAGNIRRTQFEIGDLINKFRRKRHRANSDDIVHFDLNLRRNGQIIKWLTYSVDLKNVNTDSNVENLKKKIENIVYELKNLDVHYQNYYQSSLLGEDISRPTIIGFPLTLNLEFVSVINADITTLINANLGEIMNIPSVSKQPRWINLQLDFKPGVSVRIDGTLSIDAHLVEVGVKASSTLNTATDLNFVLKLVEGREIEFTYNTPYDVQDLIGVQTDIYTTIEEKGTIPSETAVNFSGARYSQIVQSLLLSDYFGATVQMEIDMPALSFKPTFGPSKFVVRLIKTDPRVTGYYAAISYKKGGRTGNKSLSFVAQVMGRDQKASLVLSSFPKEKKLTAQLTVPSHDILITGFILDTDTEYSFNLNVMVDSATNGIKLGAYLSGKPDSLRYQPFLMLVTPNDLAREQALSGMRLSQLKAQTYLPISFNGSILVVKNPNNDMLTRIDLESLTLNTVAGKLELNGVFSMKQGNFIASLYTSLGENQGSVTFSYDRQEKDATIFIHEYKIEILSRHRESIFQYRSQYESAGIMKDLKIELDFGPDKIMLHENLELSKSPASNKYVGKWLSKVSASIHQLELELASNMELYDKQFATSISYTQDKVPYKIEVTGKFDKVNKGDIDTTISITFEEQNLLMTTKWYEKSKPNEYSLDGQIKTFTGNEITIKSDVIFEWTLMNFTVQLTSVITNDNNVYKFQYAFKYDSKNAGFMIAYFINNDRYATGKVMIASDEEKYAGDIVLYLKDVFDHFLKYNKQKQIFTGQLQFYIPNNDHMIAGQVKISEVEPKNYDGEMSLNWDATKGNLNSIKIASKTGTENGIRTNNKIDFKNKQFEVNANVLLLSDTVNGNISADAEIILPDNKGRIVANLKHLIERNQNGLSLGDRIELYRKKSNDDIPMKFTYEFAAKNIDRINGALKYDVTADFNLDLPKNKNYKTGFALKKIPIDLTWTVTGQTYLSGSGVSVPVDLKIESNYPDAIYKYGLAENEENLSATYTISGLIGSDYTINVKGDLSPNTFTSIGKVNVPSQNGVNSIAWSNSESFAIGDDGIKITSENSVTYDGNLYVQWNILTLLSLSKGKLEADWETAVIKKRHLSALYILELPGSSGGIIETNVDLSYDEKNIGLRFKYTFDYLAENLAILANGLADKPVSVTLKRKMSEDFRNHVVDIIISNQLGDWHLSSDITLDNRKPRLNVEYRFPEGESKVLLLADQISPVHWYAKTELKWSQDEGGYLNADYESKLNYPTDLLLIINVDSPKLNIPQWHLKAVSTKTSAEKKINLNIATANVPYITGNLVYDVQQDEKKTLVHGSGQVNIKTKNYPLVFKYIQQTYDMASDGEEGTLDKCYISVDGKSNVWNLEKKITDKTVILRREYCENGDCHTMGLSYEIKIYDLSSYERSLLLQLDMKPMIKDGENIVIASKTVNNGITYDHNTDFQWAPEKMISYKSYVNDKKLGASLTLPSRQIVAEYSYAYKLSLGRSEIKTIGTVWLDKGKNDRNKIVLLSGGYYNIDEDKSTLTIKTTSALQIPNLQKKLSVGTDLDVIGTGQKIIDFKANIDVFNTEDRAIIITYQLLKDKNESGIFIKDVTNISSKGQKMDVEIIRALLLSFEKFGQSYSIKYVDANNSNKLSSLDIEIQLTSIVTSMNILDLVKFKDTFTINGSSQFVQLSNRFDILDRYYTSVLKLTTEPKILLGVDSKGFISQRLEASLSAVYNEAANVNIQLTNKKGKKTMLNSRILLTDKDFLDTDSEINIDAVTEIMEDTKKEYLGLIAAGKLMQRKLTADLKDQYNFGLRELQNALIPKKTFAGGVSDYIKTVNVELLSDESFNSTANNLSLLLNNTMKVLIALNNQLADLANKFENVAGELYERIMELLKRLMPSLFDWIDETYAKLMDYIDKLIEDASGQLNDWLEYIKTAHQHWREILKAIANILKDLIKNSPKIKERFIQRYNWLKEKIAYVMANCPFCNLISRSFEKLNNSDIPRYMWNALSATGHWLKEYMPTMEVKTLLDTLLQLMEKIISQKPINVIVELKNTAGQLINAVRSIVDLLNKSFNVLGLVSKEYLPTINLPFIKNVVMSSTNVLPMAVNALKMLRYPDFSLISDSLYMYRPNLNPADLLPPYKKAAVIVNGQHVITFNGRYITVTSECPVLLTTEAENGAFTILANFENGRINKIFMMANNSETIEVLIGGKVLFNGSESDLPIYGSYVTAVRTYYNIEIQIDNSVRLICSLDLNIIAIHVSGFYHGDLDGLLGSANGEPISDTFEVNSAVLSSIQKKSGNYQSVEKCAKQITEGKPSDVVNDRCSELFSTKSVLRKAFFVINPDVYRAMCHQIASDVAESEDKLKNACRVSLAYSLVSSANGDFLEQPSQCGFCLIGNDRIPIGADVSLSTPQGKAEILIILETSETNKVIYDEFLKKMILNLPSYLKLKGIQDMKFILMTYGPNENYPTIKTTNGDIYLTDQTKIPFSPYNDKQHTTLGYAVQDIKYVFGQTDITKILKEAANYPFSANAVKAVIIAKGKLDEKPSFDLLGVFNFINGLLPAKTLLTRGTPVVEITPIEKISYIPNRNLTIYGFDGTRLYTTSGEINIPVSVMLKTNLYEVYQSSMLFSLPLNGAVFSASELSSLTNDNGVTDTFIKRIVGSLALYERYTDCTCLYKWGNYAEPECVVKFGKYLM